MPSQTITLDSTTKRGAVFAAGIFAFVFAFFVIKWTLANAASTRADLPEIARLATQLAPDDPQTHYSAAVLLEKQFEIESLEAAVKEYEKAAALSPSNYLYWLALGSARERAGDRIGSESALRRALELAPHYSRVHWALGNVLVRQGKMAEGFGAIRQAAENDKTFIKPAASLALQLFNGDLNEVKKAVGDSNVLNRSLPLLLAGQKRYEDAFDALKSLPSDDRKQAVDDFGDELASQFAAAKKYRYAASVQYIPNGAAVEHEKIANGSFEDPIKLQNASVFDWQIPAGQQPQVAVTNGQKRSGNVSLVLVFNSTQSSDFRVISQLITVEPGKQYELEVFYRSDLKTKVGFNWEIVDASTNTVITTTDATPPSSDWTRVSAHFRVPATTDGIIIRLGRVNCEGPVCQVAGNLWFDDISLKGID